MTNSSLDVGLYINPRKIIKNFKIAFSKMNKTTIIVFSIIFLINIEMVNLFILGLGNSGGIDMDNLDPAIIAALILASRTNDRARDNLPNILKIPTQLNSMYGEKRSMYDQLKNNSGIQDYIPSINATKNLFDLFSRLIDKFVF